MSGVHRFGSEFKTKDTEALKRKAMKDVSDDKNKQKVSEKGGETTTNQVNDVRALLEQAEQDSVLDARNAGMVVNDITGLDDKETVDTLDSKYADCVAYSNDMGLNIKEFISYMIEGKDLSGDEVTELLISFVQEVLMNPEYGKVTIFSLSQIIDILNEHQLVNSNVNLVELIPQLVNYMLAQNDDNVVNSHATFGDIKDIVNKMIEEIIAKRPPVEPEPTEPDPVEPDPLEELFNQHKFNNSSFVAAYIDTVKDEFCLKDSYSTTNFYTIIKNQLLAKVAELGAENIDFSNAKQIIYDTMHSIWPLKSEVADVIANTANGKDLSADEIAEMVDSISNDIFTTCYYAYYKQTEKIGFTPEEQLALINQVLKSKYLDLYEPQTAEEAKDLLYHAMNNEQQKNYPTGVIQKANIAEFLTQVKDWAIKYVQLSNPDKNYSTEFCEMLVMFMIQTIEHKYSNTNQASVSCSSLRDKIIAMLSDLSFLDTSNDRFMGVVTKGNNANETWITRIQVAHNGDGYQLFGTHYINSENNLSYNADGSINQGVFFTFMTDFLRDTIFGGQLNESELQALYEKILKKFAGSNYKNGQVALNPNGNDTTNFVNGKYDKNGDGSWFDDFYRAMMEVASEVNAINIDEVTNEDVNLDVLFGSGSSISTSDIHNNASDYLLSNDPAIRLIMGELINASDKYNITPDADYLDFFNVFVQEINKEAGVADILDNKGNQILTREALEKYLQKHSIQELKDFIQGTELRDAYFESTFKINGEIEGFYQDDTGDCWLLSGVMALNSSPEGREIIKNAIKYDPETGKYSVTFYGGYDDNPGLLQGFGQKLATYEFTKQELFDLMATGMYSKLYQSEDGTCDWDLFLLEVCVSALKQDQQKYNPYLDFAENNTGDHNIYMGTQAELIGYLTGTFVINNVGGTPDPNCHGVDNVRQKVLELLAQGLIEENGNIHNYAFYFGSGANHAYAITKITADKIYFINPGDSTTEYYIKWEDLINNEVLNYYDSNGTKAGTITIQEIGYVGPLDESPALNQD